MRTTLLERRVNIITYIYTYELLDKKIDLTYANESGDFDDKEISIIKKIIKHYESFKKMIQKNLSSSWTWNRISPLTRAILIFGSYELSGNDKALVINEMVIITKEFIPDDTYKFVNGILEMIYQEYNKES